jgi:hypothetical protein
LNRKPPDGWHCEKPMAWCRAIRPVALPAGQMCVALALASFANAGDGKNARPGLSRLQWVTGTSRSTVVSALGELEQMWLLHCHERSTGRGHASVYWLTVHDEIERYGSTFEDWTDERRPADASGKGSATRPFRGPKGPVPPPQGSRISA